MNNEKTSEPIRICHLGKFYPPAPGGVETYVRTLAQAQAKLGASVRVCCMNHENRPTTEDLDGPVSVVRLSRKLSFAKLDWLPDLRHALRSQRMDILHLHAPNPTMILGVLVARPRVPVVVTYNSDHIKQWLSRWLFRPFEHQFYRQVGAIIATSRSYAEASPLLRCYSNRLHVLPLGVDLEPYLCPTDRVKQEAEEIARRYPGPIWLMCGRLVYYKGVTVALEALRMVPGTLLIVGDGRDRARFENEARRLGVFGRAIFLGQLPTVFAIRPYYLAAKAFWFPSCYRSEAFGIVQVEAMASGCPVINTAIPGSGVSWVSLHEESGLTVPINDSSALASAALRLIQEPGLRERLAAGARQRACAEFEDMRIAERSLELYQQVLHDQASDRPALAEDQLAIR